MLEISLLFLYKIRNKLIEESLFFKKIITKTTRFDV